MSHGRMDSPLFPTFMGVIQTAFSPIFKVNRRWSHWSLIPPSKLFAISFRFFQAGVMTSPLALVVYENLLPGSQLANRLQDMGYRVQAITDPGSVLAQAEAEKPLVVLMDLDSKTADICDLIKRLKENPATGHLPVLAYADQKSKDLQQAAIAAGATLVAIDTALLAQLPQLLEQALEVQ
jgi:CheY-like chemotaxis protein